MYKNKKLEAIYHAIPKDHEAKMKVTMLFSLLDNYSEKDKTAEETLHCLKIFLNGEKPKEDKKDKESTLEDIF